MLAKLPKPDPASVVEEAQPTINPLNTQAMAAASKQANEYFDAARQGKYLQQPTAFPPEVLSGLLAQAMLNQRFMLSFDRNLRGKPRGSARGSSEQAGTACGATSVASGQLACEVQQGQPHQPLPTAMLSGE